MIKVTYVQPDGSEQVGETRAGDSVMQAAVNAGVPGIIAECGGSMACATCHVYVDDAWADKTGERSESEEDMLDCAMSEMKPTSRLSCQVKLTQDLDGLVVHIPEDM